MRTVSGLVVQAAAQGVFGQTTNKVAGCSFVRHQSTNERKKAEKIYVKYRQHIISGLKHIDKNKKIVLYKEVS